MIRDILIVEDEPDIGELISESLASQGFKCRIGSNSTEAFELIAKKIPDVIVLDVWLKGSDLDGLGILEVVKTQHPAVPVVVISGHGTIETALKAIRIGAYDYLEKPFTDDRLTIVVKNALEAAKLQSENSELRSEVIDKTHLVGNSTIVMKMRNEIERIASSSSRVMINGGIGSGKELAARLIHKHSKVSNGSFIRFNPTGKHQDLILEELFGDVPKKRIPGTAPQETNVIERASHGILYIDEISNLPLVAQDKLLDFLVSGTISTKHRKSVKVDVRVIISTSRDFTSDIERGKFRSDLYQRLNVVTLKVPNLADRKEDIPLLAEHFVKQFCALSGLPRRKFSHESIVTLQAYGWPGNLRELQNVIESCMIMNRCNATPQEDIMPSMLPLGLITPDVHIAHSEYSHNAMFMPLREAREMFEKHYLSIQMNRHGGNISRTADSIGMERSALHRKLKALGVALNGDRTGAGASN